MMGIVCIDTHIVIWGIKKQATKGQENMISRAESFLNWLDENKKKIIIPVPVISELLVPVPNEAIEIRLPLTGALPRQILSFV